MTLALGIITAICVTVVCVLAVLLNPGLGVLMVMLSVLTGIYALRSVLGRAARSRRQRKPHRKENRTQTH